MSTVKYSRQREAILSFLEGRTDHPTADVIYENVKDSLPNISLGTVYRNLSLLTELGQIRRITPGDGKEHFDPNTSAHTHFICRCCGGVFDHPYQAPAGLLRNAQAGFNGTIERSEIRFFGLCASCRDRSAAVG